MIDFATIAPYLNILVFLLTLPVIYFSWAFSHLSRKLGIGLVAFFLYSSIMRLVIALSSFNVIDPYWGKEVVPPIYFPFWIGLVIIFYIVAKSLNNMPDARSNIQRLEDISQSTQNTADSAQDTADTAQDTADTAKKMTEREKEREWKRE